MVRMQRKMRVGWLMSASMAALLADTTPGLAGSFIVDFPSTLTNGGFTINGDDSLTITPDGSIKPPIGVRGVISTGGNNEITNEGEIETQGTTAFGIVNDNSPNSPVSNSGSLHTEGVGAYGIVNDNSPNSPVSNSGSLHTEGNGAHGIFNNNSSDSPVSNSGSLHTEGVGALGIFNVGSSDSPVSNSGSLHTEGLIAYGIFNVGSSNSPVSNSGSLHTEGYLAFGIYNVASFNSPVSNSGSLHTEGASAFGIYNSGSFNSPVTNTGSIFTAGAGSYGIWNIGSDNSPVNNTGYVVSAQSESIRMESPGGILNLGAPAFLGGAMNFVSPTTVNVVTGRSHSILWDFSTGTIVGGDPNISGSVPWFYDPATKKLATFDPTVLSASVDALASVSGNISGLIQGRLAGGGSGAYVPSMVSSYAGGQQSAAQSRLDDAYGEGASSNGGTYANPAGWWIAGFGSQYDYSGGDTTFDTDVGYAGLAIGVDADLNANLRAGFLGGWGNASMSANSKWADSVDTEQEGFFGSVYARARSSGFFLDAALSGGMFDVSGDRFVNDNLAYLGNSSAESDSSAWWLSPEIAAGLELAAGNGWTYIPAARLRYAMQSADGYSESGAGAGNASVDDQDIAVAEGRLEIAASRQMDSVLFTGRLGWLTQWAPSDNEASVTMLGITQTVSADGGDRQAGFAGVDLTVAISDALDFTAAGEATFGADITGGRLSAGLVAKF
jgi:hypothetical protein